MSRATCAWRNSINGRAHGQTLKARRIGGNSASISGARSRTYGYDSSGNTTSDGTAAFTYNDAGRKVSATKASVTTTYALNALGQRVKKTNSGSSTYFVYDEAGHLVGEYDNSGNLIEETVWLADIPVAMLRPNGGGVSLFYVHTDHLNTPRRVSRPSDSVVLWRWESDPFGTTSANEDPDGDSNLFVDGMRFPGQYFDVETGLHYNYYRDGYDPMLGRYTQSDPIGLSGGLNTYLYVDGTPVLALDPLGLKSRVCCKRLGATLGLASHCYIETLSDGLLSNAGLLGSWFSGEPWGTGNMYWNNAWEDSEACGDWSSDCSDADTCVRNTLSGYPNPSHYNLLLGPNSNSFAGHIARTCNLRKPRWHWTPGWRHRAARQKDGTTYTPPKVLGPARAPE